MDKWVKIKILDKNKKAGLFADSYKLVLCFIEEGVSCNGTQTVEMPCNLGTYYKMDVGKECEIQIYQHTNGLWYPFQEKIYG